MYTYTHSHASTYMRWRICIFAHVPEGTHVYICMSVSYHIYKLIMPAHILYIHSPFCSKLLHGRSPVHGRTWATSFSQIRRPSVQPATREDRSLAQGRQSRRRQWAWQAKIESAVASEREREREIEREREEVEGAADVRDKQACRTLPIREGPPHHQYILQHWLFFLAVR